MNPIKPFFFFLIRRLVFCDIKQIGHVFFYENTHSLEPLQIYFSEDMFNCHLRNYKKKYIIHLDFLLQVIYSPIVHNPKDPPKAIHSVKAGVISVFLTTMSPACSRALKCHLINILLIQEKKIERMKDLISINLKQLFL